MRIPRVKHAADKVLRSFGLLGLYTAWLGIAALCIPAVRPHFLRLLYRSLVAFTNFKSTTPWSFVSFDLIQPVLLLVFFVVLLHQSHGEEAVRIHWKKDGVIGVQAIGLLVIFYYMPISLWKSARLVWEDHQQLVTQKQEVQSENKLLISQLADAKGTAEQRCEQGKGDEIKRLKKQLISACFNPDRRLLPMEREELFTRLKQVRVEMEKQHQQPLFRIDGFYGDSEIWRFVGQLEPIFTNAGWKWVPPSTKDPEKLKAEQSQQEEWIKSHFPVEGILVFDKKCPKCFGSSVGFALSGAGIGGDWTQNQEQVSNLPYLEVLTVWVGYKPVLTDTSGAR